MTITITHRLSNGTNTDGSPTTASLSVSAGDVLVLELSSGSVAGNTDAPTSFGGTLGSTLTWQLATSVLMFTSGRGRVSTYYAICPSNASGTVTINFPGSNTSNSQWTFTTLAGVDLTTPVRQVKTGQMSGTNPSITLDATPLAGSIVLAALMMNTNTTPTAGTGKTIIGTTFVGTSPSIVQAVEYDIGSATAATAFVSPSTANKGMVAVEFQEPVSADATVTPPAATATAAARVPAVGRDLVAEIEYPAIAAHRGGAGEAPEDTLTAFTQTFAALPKVIGELDLRLNQSGSLVLMHDVDVDRVAAGGATGLVTDYTDAEWDDLDIEWPIPPGGTPVPASYWDEVRDAFPTRILAPETSTTGGTAALVADIAADPNLTLRLIGQAFNKTHATSLAAAGLRTIQLYSNGATIDLAEDVANGMYGVGLLYTDTDLDSDFCDDAHALGLKVWAYTVNTTGARDTLFAMGVDVVFTDFPTLFSATDAEVDPPAAATSASAPTPAVSGQRNAVVMAAVATATAAALVAVGTGTMNPTVDAPTATATAVAPAPTVAGEQHATVAAPTAVATATGHDPTVTAVRSVTISPPVTTATGAGHVPSIFAGGSATLAPPTATSTAAAPTPLVTATRVATVQAPTASATATAPAPGVAVPEEAASDRVSLVSAENRFPPVAREDRTTSVPVAREVRTTSVPADHTI